MANLNDLIDEVKYKATCDIMYFCNEGKILSGKFIKKNLPFELSPHEPMSNFFKKIIKKQRK